MPSQRHSLKAAAGDPSGKAPEHGGAFGRFFAVLYGAFLGLALLKFGNPVVLDRLIEPPADFWQAVYSPWPMAWGQAALAGVVLLGLAAARFQLPRPRWLMALPLVWFGWQFLASAGSVDAHLSQLTLLHFTTCIACLMLGYFTLGRREDARWFFAGLLPFFLWMAWQGFDQHYGGLDATERMIKETPNWQQAYPPEYLERIAKKRIFATLVYPNALAGVVLLLLPPLLVAAWSLAARLTPASRLLVTGLLGYMGAACLVWSGSKSGWLIALALLFVVVLRRPLPRRIKLLLLAAVCAAGLAGFGVKFAPYFRKGATSVGARFQYWRAALLTVQERPLFGSGPGTFSRAYAKVKPPGAEMAQLTHNDYLEQASDSGVAGFLGYAGFWLGAMGWLWRRLVAGSAEPFLFAVWLGLLGWTLQSFSEFGLYIPALAWPAFTLIGWLWARENSTQAAS